MIFDATAEWSFNSVGRVPLDFSRAEPSQGAIGCSGLPSNCLCCQRENHRAELGPANYISLVVALFPAFALRIYSAQAAPNGSKVPSVPVCRLRHSSPT